MLTLINLLLTLGKRYIVNHGTLDYFFLTWASKVFCLQASQTIEYYVLIKNLVQVLSSQKINEQPG